MNFWNNKTTDEKSIKLTNSHVGGGNLREVHYGYTHEKTFV